jgi:hypothetical protein
MKFQRKLQFLSENILSTLAVKVLLYLSLQLKCVLYLLKRVDKKIV